jgi:valyl-tRNA synthetase
MLEGQYNHQKIEPYWSEKFAEIFRANPDSPKKKFCITIPPPNITGSLHIGHALNMTVQDVISRYKRMQGFEVLWVPGTDHAGIATQHVVSRELEKKGLKREDLGREEFLKFVDEWREYSQKRIMDQMKKLCLSVDWSANRFTLDEGYRKAVAKAFAELYKKGFIYQGDYIVNWCPSCKTALSDLEVEFAEENGKLYYILYPFEKNLREGIYVATTRPETLLGDTAVAVHPEDERYKDINEVFVPLVWRKVKVIRDEKVDMNFGTGAVKITPFHDFADFEIAREHNLEGIKIMNEDGVITYGDYAGLDRFSARKKIVEDLEKLGLLQKIEDYKIRIGRCYRCKTIVEPLVSKQWFLKMKELSQKAIEVVETDKVKFLAEQWKNLYLSWMRNVRDWCISRQIWWGHPIPISTCRNCGEKFLNSDGEQEWNLCPKCGSEKVEREKDVLDTWFSSALWPFAVLGWPEQTKKLKAFYPTDILVTGFDIIFFWVARMIVMGLFFMGDVPFRKVYVHGLIRDEKGQKMSKTRGNVLDPLDLVEKYGSDSLRFSLCVLSSQIKDIKLSEKTIESYYHFMNKIWNAAKFVIMNVENPKKNFQPKTLPQMWILAKLSSCIEKVKEYLEDYKINQAAMEIYEFFWNDFCDWYIEISKVEMQDEKTAQSAKNTLLFVLETSLRLLHPFCPAITSHIWDEMRKKYDIESESEFLSYAPFPDFEYKEETCLEFGEKLISVAKEIRSIKDEVGFKVSDKVQAKVLTGDEKELKRILGENIKWLEKLSGANIDIVEGEEIPEGFIPSSGKGVVVAISSEGAKLKESIQKIGKELAEAEKEFDRVKKRLSNLDFLEKADPEVIQEHKKRLEELGPKIEFLRKRIEILSKFVQN